VNGGSGPSAAGRAALFGEPDTQIVINRPATVELTCASVVNRLPDVINAQSGYTTTDRMPTNSYKVQPLHEHHVAR
jgi:4-hydroxy-tetrahydrodipicolinate reductase